MYACVLTGVNDIDDAPKYARFQHALETAMRRVAKTGSRLFKMKDIMSKSAWIHADVWRKHRCVIFLLRYYREDPNYSSFNDFRMKDHIQRVKVIKTFEIRFQQLHDCVGDEECWEKEEEEEQDHPAPEEHASVADDDAARFVYDSEEDSFVPNPKTKRIQTNGMRPDPSVERKAARRVRPESDSDNVRVSSRIRVCVLMHYCVCPYALMHVSSYYIASVLTYPLRVSSRISVCVLIY